MEFTEIWPKVWCFSPSQKQEQQRQKLDNLLQAASPEDRVDIEQQLTECQGNIQQLQGELHSLQGNTNEFQETTLSKKVLSHF